MRGVFYYCGKPEHQNDAFARQRGAILVEAMVTIVITAVGLLGIVGMLVAGIASSNKSLYRSSAVYMANEISERMRSNVAGVKANAYAVAGSNTKVCRTSPSVPIPSTCTSAELADYDVYDWKAQIGRSLPGGTGTIANVSGVSWASDKNQYEITVSWLEDKTTATQMNFKLRFEP